MSVWLPSSGWLTLLGLIITRPFLLAVKDIPMTEERALESRGESCREYQLDTSKSFPWPPRTRPKIEESPA